MSTWTMARIPRAALALASAALLVAATLGTGVPVLGASSTPAGSVLAPVGHFARAADHQFFVVVVAREPLQPVRLLAPL